ncbi:MAG: type II toxin-antitoxin system RelE/ParE family toxin [Bacteroidetes bacterium]|nr:MAG: type II toxin-antitoxin system RelE/ParE family toxin [Bacteroidota bacterium]
MWEIHFNLDALKFFNKLDNKLSFQIKEKLNNLKQWIVKNESVNIDIKKLKGEWEGFYRLRHGNMRIILSFDKENQIITVHEIALRGDIY